MREGGLLLEPTLGAFRLYRFGVITSALCPGTMAGSAPLFAYPVRSNPMPYLLSDSSGGREVEHVRLVQTMMRIGIGVQAKRWEQYWEPTLWKTLHIHLRLC